MYTSPLFLRKKPHSPGPSTLWELSVAGSVLGAPLLEVKRLASDTNLLCDFGKVTFPLWLSVFLISELRGVDMQGDFQLYNSNDDSDDDKGDD